MPEGGGFRTIVYLPNGRSFCGAAPVATRKGSEHLAAKAALRALAQSQAEVEKEETPHDSRDGSAALAPTEALATGEAAGVPCSNTGDGLSGRADATPPQTRASIAAKPTPLPPPPRRYPLQPHWNRA